MAHEKPGFMDKMKDVVTGHKPGHGTGKAGTDAQQDKYDTGRPLTEEERAAYGAPHAEKKHGFVEKMKEKIPGTHEHEAAKAAAQPGGLAGAPGAVYPTGTTPSATYTDPTGHTVEGPRSGASPRKEGMMAKVKDKLHMGGHKDDHSTY